MSEWSRLQLVTPPASPVVGLTEAKRRMRVFHDEEDEDIAAMIASAEAHIEGPNGCGIALMPQTWRLSLDGFPRGARGEIIVPLGPVTAIESIEYTDANGDAQSVDEWRVDLDTQPCRIWPARDTCWPTAACEPGAVKVKFTCGFSQVPEDLRTAVLLLAGHWFENREAAVSDAGRELRFGVTAVIEKYRAGRFG